MRPTASGDFGQARNGSPVSLTGGNQCNVLGLLAPGAYNGGRETVCVTSRGGCGDPPRGMGNQRAMVNMYRRESLGVI